MDKIIDKIKAFLDIILNYFKSLLSSLFGGINNIFTNEEVKNKELESIKLDNENKDLVNKVNSSDSSGYHNESPASIILNKDASFKISLEKIEKLILEIFCKELEIEEKELSKGEKDYLEQLNEKIIPIITKEIEIDNINNENNLVEKIKKLIKVELENQLTLEQANTLTDNKIVITPLLLAKQKQSSELSTNNKSSFLETKIRENFSEVKEGNNNISPITLSNKEDINIASINLSNNNDSINNDFNINTSDNNIEEIEQGNIETLFPEENSINSSINIANENNFIKPEIKTENNNLDSKTPILENTLVTNEPHTLDSAVLNNNAQVETNIPMSEERKEIVSKEETKQKSDEILEIIDFKEIDYTSNNISYQFKEEIKKEELEDKNYELLEKQLNDLLVIIQKLKLKNLSPSDRENLIIRETNLISLRDTMNFQKQKDIRTEENMLDETILTKDLNDLELELQKLHIDEKIDLQEYMIQSLEDLDNLNLEKAQKIEKELLKIRLNKTLHAFEISSLIALPFIRNKYFLFFTCGLLANRHLKLFDSILKRKTLEYTPVDIAHIKTGAHALEDALLISNQNIEYLNYLESEAFKKYPELRFDDNYLNNLNSLKTKLIKNQERLLKKEKMIQKHNLKINKRIRKLNNKENQNI